MIQQPARSPGPWENARVLVVDTETTGLQEAGKLPFRLVSIGWVLCRSPDDIEEEHTFRISPDTYRTPAPHAGAGRTGVETSDPEIVPCREALSAFWSAYERCDVLVGHNLDFDELVIYSESVDQGLEFSVAGQARSRVCTMKESAGLFCVPAARKEEWKWPSLLEVYYALYPFHLLKERQPSAGARICARCFFALKDRGLLSQNGNKQPFWRL